MKVFGLADKFQVECFNNDDQQPKMLSVISRHMPTRNRLFEICKTSLRNQTSSDFEHWVLTDYEMKGTAHANRMYGKCREHMKLNGMFVLNLDDDDKILYSGLVDRLAGLTDYDVIFMKGMIGGRVFPLNWESPPQFCGIGSFNYIVKREVFYEFMYILGEDPKLDGTHIGRGEDFRFIKAVHNSVDKAKHLWLDEIVCGTQQVGWGKSGDPNCGRKDT